MKNKHDYVVWRENKGFFTALDRNGQLATWSLLTGDMLYTLWQSPEQDGSEKNLSEYQVYRSTDDDITYTRDAYKLGKYSISLLRRNFPEYEEDSAFLGVSDGMVFVNGP